MSNLKKEPVVSIVMPAYNAEAFISEAIDSILVQTYSQFELIIVVDGGCDNTASIVRQYTMKDSRIKAIFHSSNRGVAMARNSGIATAIGEFIGFCDSDDLWVENKIELQLQTMKRENAAICHSSALVIDGEVNLTGKRRIPKIVNSAMMLKRNLIINSSALIDVREAGKIYQRKIRHEDYDMWLRIFSSNIFSVGTDMEVVKYRVHGNNMTANIVRSVY